MHSYLAYPPKILTLSLSFMIASSRLVLTPVIPTFVFLEFISIVVLPSNIMCNIYARKPTYVYNNFQGSRLVFMVYHNLICGLCTLHMFAVFLNMPLPFGIHACHVQILKRSNVSRTVLFVLSLASPEVLVLMLFTLKHLFHPLRSVLTLQLHIKLKNTAVTL